MLQILQIVTTGRHDCSSHNSYANCRFVTGPLLSILLRIVEFNRLHEPFPNFISTKAKHVELFCKTAFSGRVAFGRT